MRARVIAAYVILAVWVGSFLVLILGPSHSNKGLLAVNGTMVVLLGLLFADVARRKNGGG